MIPKWSRIFYVSIVTVSLLVSCAVAVDTPEAEASSSGASTRLRSVSNYIDFLDVNEINRLPSTFAIHQDRHEDPRLPFYGRTPLYSVAADPQVVKQALRDHKRVGIVDPAHKQAALILWEQPKTPTDPSALLEQPLRSSDPGRLVRRTFERPEEVLEVFALDSSFHQLKKAALTFAHRGLRANREYVDDFMHVHGIPILPRSATFGQLVGASTQDEDSFTWLESPTDTYWSARGPIAWSNRSTMNCIERSLRYETSIIKTHENTVLLLHRSNGADLLVR